MSTERVFVIGGSNALNPQEDSSKLLEKFSLHCKQILCSSLSSISVPKNSLKVSLEAQTDVELVSDNILVVQQYNSKQMKSLATSSPFWNVQELMSSVFNTLKQVKAKNLYVLFWDMNGVDTEDKENDPYISTISSQITAQVVQLLPQILHTQVSLFYKKPFTKQALLQILSWFLKMAERSKPLTKTEAENMSSRELEDYVRTRYPDIQHVIFCRIQGNMIWVLHGGRDSMYIPLASDPPKL